MTTLELSAGGLAGAMGILTTQPLDTIRIRLQDPKQIGHYRGILGCAQATLKGEGMRGLFKGVGSPMLTVGIMNALLFFTYEGTLTFLKQAGSGTDSKSEPPSLGTVATAGAISGAVSAFVTAPTELVKCIAQMNVRSKGTLEEEFAIFKRMYQRHGLLGAHGPRRGLGITVIRETPSFATYFCLYEALSRRYEAHASKSVVSLVAGGFAGMAAWVSE